MQETAADRGGGAPNRLLIAVVLDQKRAPLAVRVLRSDVGDFVLDVLTKRIRPWARIGYAFLRMQDPHDPSGWGQT
ncbi:transglutaminase-like cysteine peptidase [Fuscovulum ytuae]|uniref:Transglutaminase-like cysteine peptidase n=1 Tax=Fuscovulum ytuae TaxID=3042299 RepID=A0ABY8QC62_9RHOB|nr:transglutaminase-like cysteine peptidase [Fuscovulum sp. YMD61]WGV17852.1 transglutaminase-like cysteine peptidase [Fuscovulum sp. YMD61]